MVDEEKVSVVVSVIMITYGHEKYIRQAIEGVLMQDCTFPVQLIVANDNSPDGTDEVVTEIIATHPKASWIKYQCQEKNLGVNANYVWAAKQATGKYIASCEGDDYWTDRQKLQKQVDFLEAHQEYVCVHHPTKAIREATEDSQIWNEGGKDTISILDLAERNQVMTVSCLFRNPLQNFPDWISTLPIGDYPLHLFNAQYGLFKKMPDVMATYRIHNGGIFALKSEQKQLRMMIDTINGMIGHFNETVNNKLLEQQAGYLETYAEKYSVEDFNYLPKSFSHFIKENKVLRHRALEIGSAKGFLHLKWTNFQRKFLRTSTSHS